MCILSYPMYCTLELGWYFRSVSVFLSVLFNVGIGILQYCEIGISRKATSESNYLGHKLGWTKRR